VRGSESSDERGGLGCVLGSARTPVAVAALLATSTCRATTSLTSAFASTTASGGLALVAFQDGMRAGDGPLAVDDGVVHGDAVPRAVPHPGCGRGFARNFNMQSHYKSHLGVREYDCLWCSTGRRPRP
jgi:hypothetical protein